MNEDNQPINENNDAGMSDEDNESLMSSSTLLYSGIALANIVLIIGIFFFIRRWMKKKKAAAEEEDKALLDEVNKAKNKARNTVEDKKKKASDAAEKEPIDETLTAEADKISDMLDNISDPDENTD